MSARQWKCVICHDFGSFYCVGPIAVACGCEAGRIKHPWSIKRAALAPAEDDKAGQEGQQ